MGKSTETTSKIMDERFGTDNVIALATTKNEKPHVRYVNGYYEDGCFYIITYGISNKMQQIAANASVAVAGEWFTANGVGVNLGYFCKEENREIAEKLRKAFSTWIDNGHNNFKDVNTCILCVKLQNGVLFSHGTKYEIDFTK